MKTILFLTLIVAISAGAEAPKDTDYDPATDDVAENYVAGSYLIYDCKEKHWVCVMESNYNECSLKRKRDLASVDDPFHTCAPIEKLPNKKSCFQRQLFVTTRNFGQRFCIKESFKLKNIDF